MKFKILFLFFVLTFFSKDISAQYLTVEASSGYNFYNMENLQKIQKSSQNNYYNISGVSTKIIDEFPPYFSFKIQLNYKNYKALNIGVFYDFASTGGRISYKDYSGSTKFDQTVIRKGFGFSYQYYFINSFPIRLSLYNQFHIYTSRYETEGELRISEDVYGSKLNFKTNTSFGICPGVSIEYIIDIINVGMNVGYFIDFSEEYCLAENKDVQVIFNYEPLETEWDALKLSLALSVNFNII